MNSRGLIIAVVVLLALGGVLYWSNHHKPSGQSTATNSAAPPVILKLDQNAIDQLSLARKGSAPVTLVKAGSGKWQITAPESFGADQDEVSGVLATLSSLSADRLVDNQASDLKQYGLDDPSVTVDIQSADHKERKLLLGDNAPAGSDVYAKLAGDPRVFTLAEFNKSSIDKDLNDLRDKHLLTMAPDNVSRVSLQNKTETIEFARIKDGWQILKPKPLRADDSVVDELLRTVSEARMDLTGGAGDDAAKGFAQASPVATVTLTGDQGAQTLEVRKSKDDYYARSSAVGGTYKVDTNLGTEVAKGLDDFRNKKLFDFGYDDPNRIELHQGAKAWFFLRNGSDWWSNGKKMDSAGVESLVDQVRDLQATSFPESGFSNSDFEIIVVSNDGKRTEKVQISKSASACIAKREGEPELYQLGSTAVTDLAAAADAVKPAVRASK